MHHVAVGTNKKTYRVTARCRSDSNESATSVPFALKTCISKSLDIKEEFSALDSAIAYAARYNRFLAKLRRLNGDMQLGGITFCNGTIADLSLRPSGKKIKALLEPWLEGDYCKFLQNRHQVCPDIDSFFHFCYHASGRRELIVDLQGVQCHCGSYILTDPMLTTGHDIHRVFDRFHGKSRSVDCAVCQVLKQGNAVLLDDSVPPGGDFDEIYPCAAHMGVKLKSVWCNTFQSAREVWVAEEINPAAHRNA